MSFLFLSIQSQLGYSPYICVKLFSFSLFLYYLLFFLSFIIIFTTAAAHTHTHTLQGQLACHHSRDEFFIIVVGVTIPIFIFPLYPTFFAHFLTAVVAGRMRIACGALRIQLVFIDIIQFAVVVAVAVRVSHSTHSKCICICNCVVSI